MNMQPSLFDWPAKAARAAGKDITANKHKGNAQSKAAYERIAEGLSDARAEVLCVIGRAGSQGMTCKEAAAELGVGMNVISGRFSELKAWGHIVKTGDIRDGSKAYKVKL